MGYETCYGLDVIPKKTLSIEEKRRLAIEIKDDLQDIIGEYGVGWLLNDEYCTKWYKHSEDMKLISKKHPEFLFELSGEGEENTDLWKKYYFGGEEEICKAEISYPKSKWIE